MKSQQEVEKRLERLKARVDSRWELYEASSNTSNRLMHYKKAKELEAKVYLLEWVLNKEDY